MIWKNLFYKTDNKVQRYLFKTINKTAEIIPIYITWLTWGSNIYIMTLKDTQYWCLGNNLLMIKIYGKLKLATKYIYNKA